MNEATLLLYILFLGVTLFLSLYSFLYMKEVEIIQSQTGLTIPQEMKLLLPGVLLFSLASSILILLFLIHGLS